ncbi:MAG: tRNA (cytidine(34)-2'-O)-methyltransferase [Nitrospira sp.]|nr:tRNA (cytidine(34)-2'-O)-methyltransferase [Nitrospira sp.]
MFDIILYQPEIPSNTGNIIRLCANTGARLHLVRPLGFQLDDQRLRRAGLDYREYSTMVIYRSWDDCKAHFADRRLFALSVRSTQRYDLIPYRIGDAFLFGPESKGLPDEILETIPPPSRVRLPMVKGSRNLNLSNVVAIMVYEAWRQANFTNGQ